MANRIIGNINQAENLEKLFREDKKAFELDFKEAYPEIENTEIELKTTEIN